MRYKYINSNLDPHNRSTTNFKDIISWNISSIIKKTNPISNQSLFEFKRKSMKIETIIRSEFPKGGKATVEQILVSEE